MAMLACAWIARRAFGRLRRFRTKRAGDHGSTMPSRRSSSRPHVGIETTAGHPTSSCSTRRSRSRLISQIAVSSWATATSDGTTHGRPRSRLERGCLQRDAGRLRPGWAATDPLYSPVHLGHDRTSLKGVVRDNVGHAVALKWSMENGRLWDRRGRSLLGGIRHWLRGGTLGISLCAAARRLYGRAIPRKPVGTGPRGLLAGHRRASIQVLFTAPTAFRAIRKRRTHRASSGSTILSGTAGRCFLAGERTCDPDTLFWARDELRNTG